MSLADKKQILQEKLIDLKRNLHCVNIKKMQCRPVYVKKISAKEMEWVQSRLVSWSMLLKDTEVCSKLCCAMLMFFVKVIIN